jgi:hypothetical protein
LRNGTITDDFQDPKIEYKPPEDSKPEDLKKKIKEMNVTNTDPNYHYVRGRGNRYGGSVVKRFNNNMQEQVLTKKSKVASENIHQNLNEIIQLTDEEQCTELDRLIQQSLKGIKPQPTKQKIQTKKSNTSIRTKKNVVFQPVYDDEYNDETQGDDNVVYDEEELTETDSNQDLNYEDDPESDSENSKYEYVYEYVDE